MAASGPVVDPGRTIRDRRISQADPTWIGGWAELTYGFHLPLAEEGRHEALVDAGLGLALATTFSQEFSLYSVVEVIHAGSEIRLEEAYLDYQLSDAVALRAGVVLIPMGLANMSREPISFLPVERPKVSSVIVPSPWSEVAVGVVIEPSPMWRGQLYVVSGLDPLGLSVESGLGGATQNVSLARTNGTSFAGRLEIAPSQGLELGASAYFGLAGFNARPLLFDEPAGEEVEPDVPILGLAADARGAWGGFRVTAEAAWFSIGDTAQLRRAFREDGTPTGTDSPATLFGARLEAGYDLLAMGESDHELLLFARGERYDTAASLAGREATDADEAFAITEVGGGLTWRPLLALAIKLDVTWREPDGPTDGEVIIGGGGGASY